MKSGYEIAMKEIIPAVRHALIQELKTKYNKKEEEIAKSLEITQAAISKYVMDKYSDKVKEIEKKIDHKVIEYYAKKIANGEDVASICVCTVCNTLNEFGCKFSQGRAAVATV